jgi:hypothetical protein
MLTVRTVLKLCWPTHSTSTIVDQGISHCTPLLNCVDDGSFAS